MGQVKRGEMGGLKFGVGRPTDSTTIALGHLLGWNSHPEIPHQGQPELGQGRPPFPSQNHSCCWASGILGNPAKGED